MIEIVFVFDYGLIPKSFNKIHSPYPSFMFRRMQITLFVFANSQEPIGARASASKVVAKFESLIKTPVAHLTASF